MKPEYILPLSDPHATLENVGGKGASLARLIQAGLPVPGGFHLTTAAYQQFVAENNLQSKILAALELADPAQPTTLEIASRSIHTLFMQAARPPAIAEAITRAYLTLNPKSEIQNLQSVAVRSSATAEDLPDLSFAGQQDTYLNIRGVDAVLEAVQKCWASLWTARAIGYRLQHKIDQSTVSLAVVVQTLVYADAAGVLFTANPITGQRQQTMLTATWGLGEAIVGGLVTPDTILTDKASGKVLTRETADKQMMTVRVENGTEEQPVPEPKRRAPVLTNRQAAELTRLGTQIEKLYGMPMDIEWTLAAGKFAIVQARPITTLPPAETQTPVEWKRPDPKAMCYRASIIEELPDPLTPLFATLGRRIISHGSAKLFNDLLGKGTVSEDIFITINGYAYYQMRLTLRFLPGMVTAIFKFWPEFVRSEQRWRDDAHVRHAAVIERWRSRPASALTAAELLEAARQLMTETVYTYNVLQSGVLGLAGGAEVLFTSIYGALIKRPSDPVAPVLLLGLDSLPILAEKSLYDLAQKARACPALAEHVLRTPAAQLAEQILGAQTPLGVPADDWRAWQNGFTAHLAQYGHALYDLDFAKPIPADTPAPLLETCKMYLNGQGVNPHGRQQMLADRREAATEAVRARLKEGWRLKLFNKTLGWARQLAPMREDSLADLGLGYPLLRQLLRELGRRLTQAGMLEQPDDVYWLMEDEAARAAEALDRGAPLISAADTVRQRQAQWHAQKNLTPPMTLPERSRFNQYVEKLGPAQTSQTVSGRLKGAGASQGCVTGRARVLQGPEDFGQMQPGEILVAAITTPAWTPLFAMASAIVTDIGGPLSHGSIVAREYGIPAVLGTGTATKRIHSGQTITVDGTNGIVTLPKDENAPVEWKRPNPKGIYMRGSVADLMPDPLSPLFASIGIPGILAGVTRAGRYLTHSKPVLPPDYFVAINGYAYGGVTFGPREWGWVFGRMLPAYPRILSQGIPFWRDTVRPHYQTVTAHWQAQALENLTPAELWNGVNELLDAAMYYVGTLMFATMGASAGSEGLLTRIYDKLAKRAGDPPATALLMGYNSLPMQAEKSLYDLAQWCRTHPALANYVQATPTAQLAEQLIRHQPPAPLPADWPELQQRFGQHLKQFGHIIYQLDFSNPLPLDTPAPMLENVKMYLRGKGVNPHARQQATEEKRQHTTQMMLSRLKGIKRWAFRKALNWAQSLAEVREDALADIGLGYPRLRQILHELGNRLAQAGAIAQTEDLYWLEKAEVEQDLAALARGEKPAQHADQIQARRAFWQKMKQEIAPPMVPPRKTLYGIKVDAFTPATAESQTSNVLKGAATSAGKVTAPARVLHGPEDFGQMQPGDALVAGTTTPAWTPLFAMASAVVTDIGGPLSHGSIVAREYGIPAVMGTGVATRRIKSGQMITVDGNMGIVTLSKNEP